MMLPYMRPAGATLALDQELSATVRTLTGCGGPLTSFGPQIDDRRVEFDAIAELLLANVTPGLEPEVADPVARAIAAACLGERHLWRDMGLPSRRVLRELFEAYFEPFAADNMMDMRWKKFIYRRLCRWGGFHTCSAPSCGVCPSYEECFGSLADV